MQHKTARILIVDDQVTTHAVLKGFLLQEGYDLFFATSGLEALERLAEINPDTILLDVMMPDLNGYEICQRLKADEKWRHVPIILVTALDSKEDIARGLDAGADDFLSKPVNSLELRARVRSMLRIKRQFDQLQATMQLREDLTAMIVHDIRNPLAPIMGITELLLFLGELPPQLEKDIQTLKTEAHRLNDYLNDMLMLAKMEQGELLLSREMTDINALILAVKESYQVVARSKGIELVADFPGESRPVGLDANLFQRVLDNLVSNALKFSPRQARVTIAVEHLNRSKIQVRPDAPLPPPPARPGRAGPQANGGAGQPGLRLKVIDEGPGIPEMYRASIFDKFKIVDLKEQDVPQTGLGLAFCKLVVEAHGGKIFVDANRPRGSIFTIEI
jgi:signal transduction histidine kinase